MSKTIVRFLGHTSVLIEHSGLQVIFDPNFSNKIPFIKRKSPAVFDPFALHKTNVILYSAGCHHRLNTLSLRYFKQSTQIIMPMGLSKFVGDFFSFRISELKGGAEKQISDCNIKAVKSLNKSSRFPQWNAGNCLNYILRWPDFTVLYVGESSYDGSYFHELGSEHKIDLAILPIDHVGPDAQALNKHMTPTQALQAFLDLNAKKMIPNCFGAFNWSKRDEQKFLEAFKTEVASLQLQEKIFMLSPGENLELNDEIIVSQQETA